MSIVIGDTDVIAAARIVAAGRDDGSHLLSLIAERSSSLNLTAASGETALHIIAASSSQVCKCRTEMIRALVGAGANPYLCTRQGATALDVAREGVDRESFVSALLSHRLSVEKGVRSVAPLFASRLMKRTNLDTGSGSFSAVAPHCLYYLYKGALYLWDVVEDVEHTIYQPRDRNPNLQALENKFSAFQRRRSFVSHGGEDPTFSIDEGELLEKQISSAERAVAIVSGFVTSTGLDAQKDPLPAGGVIEHILTNTGVLLEVHLTRKGIVLRKGVAQGSSRRKSVVCGGSASYPEGLVPDVRITQNCGIRFLKRDVATQVLCAIDGLFGIVAYVVAVKAPPRGGGGVDDAFGSSRPGSPQSPFFDGSPTATRGVRFEMSGICSNSSQATFLANKEDASPVTSHSMFVTPQEGCVFRVVKFRNMSPKDGFDQCMRTLNTSWGDPFAGCKVEQLTIPEAAGAPLAVIQCRQEFMLLVTKQSIFAADVNPMEDHSPSKGGVVQTNKEAEYSIQFFQISAVCPVGDIVCAASLPPQRFRRIKPSSMRYFFAVSSQVLDVFEMRADRTAIPMLRIGEDRISPQRFIPLFHPLEEQLIVMYQSMMRQEVCVLNLVNMKLQLVCKLPKPSSLRFYAPPTEEQIRKRKKDLRQGLAVEPEAALPELCFSFSFDGLHFLRYNVSMHVMSVYGWEEIRERASAAPYVNVSYIREPVPIVAAVNSRLAKREERIPGNACVWIIAECLALQRFQKEKGMTRASTFVPEGEVDPSDENRARCSYADNMNRIAGDLFTRTAMSLGARCVKYHVPPFVHVTGEGEDPLDEDEIAKLEEAYFGSQPRHDAVWCGSVTSPLEAVQCGIKLIREMIKAPWDEHVLEQEEFTPVSLEYEPLDAVQKRFPSEPDSEAVKFQRRGPKMRIFVCAGDTNSNVDEMRSKMNAAITSTVDGVVAVDPQLLKVLKPLVSFFCPRPCPTAMMGPAMVLVPPELYMLL